MKLTKDSVGEVFIDSDGNQVYIIGTYQVRREVFYMGFFKSQVDEYPYLIEPCLLAYGADGTDRSTDAHYLVSEYAPPRPAKEVVADLVALLRNNAITHDLIQDHTKECLALLKEAEGLEL